jgi:hypothetical protein
MDASGDGIQLCFAINYGHLFGLQGCSVMVAGNRQGGTVLSTFDNFRTSASVKKAAEKARVVLDLFFLILTLSCLGFALYRSLR